MQQSLKILLGLALTLGLYIGTPRAAGTAAAPDEVCPLPVGAEVPELTLTEAGGSPFELRAAVGKKPAVVVFYRGGW